LGYSSIRLCSNTPAPAAASSPIGDASEKRGFLDGHAIRSVRRADLAEAHELDRRPKRVAYGETKKNR